MSKIPLVVPSSEWARIQRWTNEDKEDPNKRRQREYVKYLNERSALLTKTWPNSVENINQRNEELRRARLAAAEQANTNFYRRHVKIQREKQERLMFSARDTIFKSKDAPKLLLSAVVETMALKEREEQLKFNEERKKEMEEIKRKDDEEIFRQAAEFREFQEEKKLRRFEENKKYKQEVRSQAFQNSEKRRKEYEEELKQQKIDLIKAQEEMEEIRKFEEDYNKSAKQQQRASIVAAGEAREARRREERELDRVADLLQTVLSDAQDQIKKRGDETEKKLRSDKVKVLELISLRLQRGDAAREAREEDVRRGVVAEREALYKAQQKALADKNTRLRNERIEMRKQFLRDEEKRLRDLETMSQWEMMNRYRNMDVLQERYEEEQKKEKIKKAKYKEAVLKQAAEDKAKREAERAERLQFYGALAERKLRYADNKVLATAAALVEEARKHGRCTRPIEKTLDLYCKINRLYPMPDLPPGIQAHFPDYKPKDYSKVDPWFKLPEAPQVEEIKEVSIDLQDDAAPDSGTDGTLSSTGRGQQDKQAAGSAETAGDAAPISGKSENMTKMSPKLTEEKSNTSRRDGLQGRPDGKSDSEPKDYKRHGRADGMQQPPENVGQRCQCGTGRE